MFKDITEKEDSDYSREK